MREPLYAVDRAAVLVHCDVHKLTSHITARVRTVQASRYHVFSVGWMRFGEAWSVKGSISGDGDFVDVSHRRSSDVVASPGKEGSRWLSLGLHLKFDERSRV